MTVGSGLLDKNWTAVRQGSFTIFVGMWYWLLDEKFTQPEVFTCGARFDPDDITRNVIVGWRLPSGLAPRSGIWGYLMLAWGNYQNTGPTVPITPRRAKNISFLRTHIAVEHVTTEQRTNGVLHEFWLTQDAAPTGDMVTLFEVGCFPVVAPSAIDFMNKATQLGTFTDTGGRSWTCAGYLSFAGDAVPYIMFRPSDNAPISAATIYWDEMLGHLLKLETRIMHDDVWIGDAWFNGLALGPEPGGGRGAARLSLTVVYA